MAIKAAELVVEVGADTQNAERGLDSINSKIEGVAKGLAVAGLELSAAFTAPIAAVAKLGFEYLSAKEQANIAFTSMLGDGQKAKAFLDDLQAFAAKTPFEFPDLIKSAQMMKAMGVAAQDVIPTLTAVGNAAASTGRGKEAIEGITLALLQMKAKGKVSAEEMNQLAERGIPGWRYLADAIGVSIPEAMKKAQKGAIDAETAIKALTDGMNKDFAGMMDKQSQSIAGMMSTLEDSARMMIGEILQPAFDELSSILQEFTKPGGYLDQFTNAWRNLSPEVKNTILVLAGVLAVAGPLALAIAGIATVVSALLSPIGLVIAAVAALAVAFTTNLGGIRDKALDIFNELKKLYEAGAGALSTYGGIVKSTWEIIKAVFSNTVGQILDIVRVFLKVLNGDWAGAWAVIQERAESSRQFLITIFSNLGNILAGIWDLIKTGAVYAWNLITDAISQAAAAIVEKVSAFFATFPERLAAFWAAVPSTVAYLLGLVIGEVVRWGLGLYSVWDSALKRIAQFIVDWAGRVWETIRGWFSNLFNLGKSGSQGFLTSIWETLKNLPQIFVDVFNSVWNFLRELPGKLWNLAKTIAGNFWEGIKAGFTGQGEKFVGDAVKNAFSGFAPAVKTEASAGMPDAAKATAASYAEALKPAMGGAGKEGGKAARKAIKDEFSKLGEDTKQEIQEYLASVSSNVKLTRHAWNELSESARDALKATAKEWHEGMAFLERLQLERLATQKRVVEFAEETWKALPQAAKDSLGKYRVVIRDTVLDTSSELDKLGTSTSDSVKKWERDLGKMRESAADAHVGIIREISSLKTASAGNFAELSQTYQNFFEALGKVSKDGIKPVESATKELIQRWVDLKDDSHLATSEMVNLLAADLGRLTADASPKVKAFVQELLGELIQGYAKAGAFTKEWIQQTGVNFGELQKRINDLGPAIGSALEGLFNEIRKHTQKTDEELGKQLAKWVGWSEDITGIIGAMPGKFGEAGRKILQSVNDWANFANKVLGILNKLNSDIPATLGDLIGKMVGMFKGGLQDVTKLTGKSADLINTALDGLGFSAPKAGAKVTSAIGKMGDGVKTAFAGMAGAAASFTAALEVTSATGSKTAGIVTSLFTSTLAGIQAGMAFGPVGGAIVGGVSLIGGIIGSIFGGKSAHQKAMEALEEQKAQLEIDKLKADVAKVTQEVMQAGMKTIQDALETLDKLADFSPVTKAIIRKFFAQLQKLVAGLIEVSKQFSGDLLNMVKAFAENVGPGIELMGRALEVFDKLLTFIPPAEAVIQAFGRGLGLIVALLIDLSDDFEKSALKHARKFANLITDAVSLVGVALTSFKDLNAYQSVMPETLRTFGADVEAAIALMIQIAERMDVGGMKAAARFAERAAAILQMIATGVGAFKDLVTYATIKAVIQAFGDDLELAITVMEAISQRMDGDFLGRAVSFSAASQAVSEAIKAGVEALKAVGELKAVPQEAFGAFLDGFTKAMQLTESLIGRANNFRVLAKVFKDSLTAGAADLIAGAQALAAAMAVFGLSLPVGGGSATASSLVGPSSAITPTAAPSSGSFAAQAAGGTSTVNHFHDGAIQVDATDSEGMRRLMAFFNGLRQAGRAR